MQEREQRTNQQIQIWNVAAGDNKCEEEQRTVRGQSDIKQSDDVPELVTLEQNPS